MNSIIGLIARVEKILAKLPELQDALDEAVHEVKAEEAAEINNAGVADQVLYLGESIVSALLEDYVENGSDEALIPDVDEPSTEGQEE